VCCYTDKQTAAAAADDDGDDDDDVLVRLSDSFCCWLSHVVLSTNYSTDSRDQPSLHDSTLAVHGTVFSTGQITFRH